MGYNADQDLGGVMTRSRQGSVSGNQMATAYLGQDGCYVELKNSGMNKFLVPLPQEKIESMDYRYDIQWLGDYTLYLKQIIIEKTPDFISRPYLINEQLQAKTMGSRVGLFELSEAGLKSIFVSDVMEDCDISPQVGKSGNIRIEIKLKNKMIVVNPYDQTVQHSPGDILSAVTELEFLPPCLSEIVASCVYDDMPLRKFSMFFKKDPTDVTAERGCQFQP